MSDEDHIIRGDLESIAKQLSETHSYDWDGVHEHRIIYRGNYWYCPDGAKYEIFPDEEDDHISVEFVGYGYPIAVGKKTFEHLENHPKYKYSNEVFGELEKALTNWESQCEISTARGCFYVCAFAFWGAYSRINPQRSMNKFEKMRSTLLEGRRAKIRESLAHIERAFQLGYFPNKTSESQHKYCGLLDIINSSINPANKEFMDKMKYRHERSLKNDATIPLSEKKDSSYEVRIDPDVLLDALFGIGGPKHNLDFGIIDKNYWLNWTTVMKSALEKSDLDFPQIRQGPYISSA